MLLVAVSAVVLALCVVGPTAATAAVFTVDSPLDEPDAIPGDGHCRSTPSGLCTLRAAVQEANALPGGAPDEIRLPPGSYLLTRPGADEDAAATGDLDVTDDLIVSGAGAAAVAIDGGGLDRVWHKHPGAFLSLWRLTVRNGHAPVGPGPASGSGGGIFGHGPTLDLSDVVLAGNTAALDGGGLAGIENHLSVNLSTIAGNTAGGRGGGLAVSGGTVVVFRATVEGNTAADGGGLASNSALLIVEESAVTGNAAAGDGGGLHVTGAPPFPDSPGLLVRESTVSGNTAGVAGGGLWRVGPGDGPSLLLSATVAGNTADGDGSGAGSGGGVHFVTTPAVRAGSTILAGNRRGGLAPVADDCAGTIASAGHNLVQTPAGCAITGDPTGNQTGLDPSLGPLRKNGGPTRTHALLPGSPAIDAGSPAFGAFAPACHVVDQRGVSRRGRCDVGAFEYRPPVHVLTGAGDGGGPHVRGFDATGAPADASLFAYAPAFPGGVRVALGDVDGDGLADGVTVPGPTGGPHVRVFSGTALASGSDVSLAEFLAYDPAFTLGVFVAAGDLDGDGRAEIVTAPGAGGGPHVRAFTLTGAGAVAEQLAFLAYAPQFTGGVTVAAGDVDGDGRADIVTGAGPGGGPHVRVFTVTGAGAVAERLAFLAYAPQFTGGVTVAAADVDGDGRTDVVTGAGPGGGPHVQVFSGATGEALAGFFAYDPAVRAGVRVAAADLDGDGRAEIVTAPGAGRGPHVRVFRRHADASVSEVTGFFAYDPAFRGGVFVAGSP